MIAAAFAFTPPPALAEDAVPPAGPTSSQPGAVRDPVTPAYPPPPAAVPSPNPAPGAATTVIQSNAEVVVTLLRTTLVAIDQGNTTGNYTVLRDLAAPDFYGRNTASDLARIFGPVRDQRIDLSQVVLLDPQITAVSLTDAKMLHVAGWLATRPTPVSFDFLFQPQAGRWRLYSVTITPVRQVGSEVVPPIASPATAPVAPAKTPKGRTTAPK